MKANLNANGFSMIEMLVAAGIVGIVALGFSSVIVNQQKAMVNLENKQESIELKNLLMQILTDGDVCSWQLEGETIKVPGTPTEKNPSDSVVSLKTIYSGENKSSSKVIEVNKAIGSRTSSPIVSKIEFKNIYELSDDNYQGNFVISLKTKSGIAPRPIEVSAIISTDPSTGKNAKKIVACGTSEGGSAGGGEWCGYGAFGFSTRGFGSGGSIKNRVPCKGMFPKSVKRTGGDDGYEYTGGSCPAGYTLRTLSTTSIPVTCQGGKEGSDYSNCSGGQVSGTLTCMKD
jgi:prepilin-type N-terminal cleavage/methylation domain-containing protein